MGFASLSRLMVVFVAITIIVAIVSFLSGMYIGGSGVSRTQTATISSMITVTKTLTQAMTEMPVARETPATSPIKLPDKIVVGLSISLSGTYATEGRRSFWGIMAAVKWVNEVYGGVNLYGKKIPIEVRYYDDESKKENVVSYTERLITVDKVHFLLGAYSTPLTFAQAPIAEKYKVLLVNWGGPGDEIQQQGYKYVVQVPVPASKYMVPALDALKAVDPSAKKVAVLYKDDETNRAAARGSIARARELGFDVVYERVYPTDIKDFSPYITDLARVGADALIVNPHFADGQLLTKQLADAGVNFKFIVIRVAPCIQDYYTSLGRLAEGILCPSLWEPGANYGPDLAKRLGAEWFGPTRDEFIRLFLNITGDPKILPSYHSAIGAAGVLVLVRAIEAAQSIDPTAVREAFNKLYLMTILGLFKIDPATGMQIAHQAILAQWQNGRFVVVWPPDIAEAKLYYPLPTWDEKRAGKVASY